LIAAALVVGIAQSAAAPIRTLTPKEATIEAGRQARDLANRLREQDARARLDNGDISDVPETTATSSAANGNTAGKR